MAKFKVTILLTTVETFTQAFEVEADNFSEAGDRAMEKALLAEDINDIDEGWKAVGDQEDNLKIVNNELLHEVK